jgi:hypothetical protein
MRTPHRCQTLAGIVCALFTALAHHASAQTTPSSAAPAAPEILLDFDRPEAWAMKYFTSATFVSGLNVPGETKAGAIGIGLEGGWLPRLSDSKQRVGFNGAVPEDLNKAPLFLRPRVTVGLPHRLAIIAAVTPPIRAFGVTPRLAALALQWTMVDGRDWSVGWRAHGQTGSVTGAITCPVRVLAFAPGSPGNPRGCDAESSDVTTLRYGGVELQTARRMSRTMLGHAAVGVNIIDGAFETRAQTFGSPDRTLLRATGVTFSTSAGVAYLISDRLAIAADGFYTPLTVKRTAASSRAIDPLINARVLLTYWIRR